MIIFNLDGTEFGRYNGYTFFRKVSIPIGMGGTKTMDDFFYFIETDSELDVALGKGSYMISHNDRDEFFTTQEECEGGYIVRQRKPTK